MERCLYRHGTRDGCNADAQCEWSSKSATCTVRKCLETTQASCSADASCQWNATTSSCARAPCQWSDSVSCESDAACQWYLGNQTCIKKICPYTTQTTCDAAQYMCQWTNGVCVMGCDAFGTESECLASSCDWTFAGVCKRPCGQRYNGQPGLCQADPNCFFQGGSCHEACEKSTTQAGCKSGSHATYCLWSGGSCSLYCTYKYGSDTTACAADPNCERYVQAVTVVNNVEAVTYGCTQKCSSLGSTGCLSGGEACLLNATSGACETTCKAKYASAELCVADSRCMWKGDTDGGCGERCELMPVCDTSSFCTLRGTTCQTDCRYLHVTKSSCDGDNNCRWDGTTGACAPACDTFTAATCPAGQCTVDGQSCVVKCAYRYSTQATCDSSSVCRWNAGTQSCTENLCRGTTQASCTAVSGANCTWQNGVCRNPCTVYVTSATCASRADCAWSAVNGGSCNANCALESGSATCGANPACTWVQFNASSSECRQSCGTEVTEAGCAALGGLCKWDAGVVACTEVCQYRYANNAAGCQSDPTCILTPQGTCADAKCYYTTAASCDEAPSCFWNAQTSQCSVKQCSYDSQTACQAASCDWVLTPSGMTCEAPICPRDASASACPADTGCEFRDGKCLRKPCYTPYESVCSQMGNCTWNTTTLQCTPAPATCQYSAWGAWSSCTIPCKDGVQYATREVLYTPPGMTCTDVQEQRPCPMSNNCTCDMTNDPAQCARLPSCQWSDNRCVPVPEPTSTCSAITVKITCDATPGCIWFLNLCIIAPTQTTLFGASAMTGADACPAGQISVDPAAVNAMPLQPLTVVYPFGAGVAMSPYVSSVSGVTISVEEGFDLGYDNFTVADGVIPAGVTYRWKGHMGILELVGNALVSTYAAILPQVGFYTSGASTAKRVITWNLGLKAIVSSKSGTMYRYYHQTAALSWTAAQALCASSNEYGATGRLASVTSETANLILSNKLTAAGWLGAAFNPTTRAWTWSARETPLDFWRGGPSENGGRNISNMYSNWMPAGTVVSTGEPVEVSGFNYAQIDISGYWMARPVDDPTAVACVCEYGSSASPLPDGLWGSASYVVGGCQQPTPAQQVATQCATVTDPAACTTRNECMWSGSACVQGCKYIFDPAACRARAGVCFLNTTAFVPGMCQRDQCAGSTCEDTVMCTHDGAACVPNTGCTAYTDPGLCNANSRCAFDAATTKCANRNTCADYQQGASMCLGNCLTQCRIDPSCALVSNDTASVCVTRTCNVAPEQCGTTAGCSVQTAPADATATFAPSAAPRAVFPAATTTLSTSIGFTVSVTANYRPSEDVLSFRAGPNPLFAPGTFNGATGTLTVLATGTANASALTAALRSVLFASASTMAVSRTVTFAVLDSMLVQPVFTAGNGGATVGQFVEFVRSAEGLTYGAAKAACAARTFQGAAGKIAALSDAAFASLAQRLLSGQSAWVGGRGTHVMADMDVWAWDDGTLAASKVFFRGSAQLGNGTSYTNWGASQPAPVAPQTFLYLVVTAQGQWAAADPSLVSAAQGVLCAYGGGAASPIPASASAVATVAPAGCFPAPCSYTNASACQTDPKCSVSAAGTCQVSTCAAASTVGACNLIAGCVFSVGTGTCVVNKMDTCAPLDATTCGARGDCKMNGATCVQIGCSRYGLDTASCNNDPSCRSTTSGSCLPRLCGYESKTGCLNDASCAWDAAKSTCSTSDPCLACSAAGTPCPSTCQCNSALVPACVTPTCSVRTTKDDCSQHDSCMWTGTACERNVCPSMSVAACPALTGCAVDANSGLCNREVCGGASEELSCLGAACVWTNTSIAGTSERFVGCAPRDDPSDVRASAEDSECKAIEKDLMPLGVLLLCFGVALAGALVWMIWRQRNAAPKAKMTFGSRPMGDELDDLEYEEAGGRIQ